MRESCAFHLGFFGGLSLRPAQSVAAEKATCAGKWNLFAFPPKRRRRRMPEHLRRSLTFSDHEWLVKASDDALEGPGPNYWGDGPENVWVDRQDALHLKITNRGGVWRCAEVVSKESLGYGRYVFHLAAGAAQINENVVLGLFTWDIAPDHAHREIDIELGRWGDPANEDAQFVVQPYEHAGNLRRFRLPGGTGLPGPPKGSQAVFEATTYLFDWRSHQVAFETWLGDPEADMARASLVASWTYTGPDIPPPGNEQLRINLWLFRGDPPSDGREVELVVRGFAFLQ
jgi:hypothetical protein